MSEDTSAWNSDAIGPIIFLLVIGLNVLSAVITSRRLHAWEQQERLSILKKQKDIISGAPPWFNRRSPGCYYLTVEDQERHIFRGWIRVGGIVAAIIKRKPVVVWDGLPDYVKR